MREGGLDRGDRSALQPFEGPRLGAAAGFWRDGGNCACSRRSVEGEETHLCQRTRLRTLPHSFKLAEKTKTITFSCADNVMPENISALSY